MVNVELVSDKARKMLCPGKPRLQEYKKVICGLVQKGFEVTSVVQLNFYPEFEPVSGVINFARELFKKTGGAARPEFLVSRAVPGSRLKDYYWKTLAMIREMEKKNGGFLIPIPLVSGGDIIEQKISEVKNSGFLTQLLVSRFEMFVNRVVKIADGISGFMPSLPAKAGCVRCGMCNVNSEITRSENLNLKADGKN